MNNYLDNYGVADARREKRTKRILFSVLALAVTAGTLWFFLRDFKEEAKIRAFLGDLQKQDYKAAYALWGCTEATPCRDYSYDSFLRDWGPASIAKDAAAIQRSKVKSCDGGIIQILQIQGQEVNLYVDRTTLLIGFSPWPVCKPRIQV